jgi:hypothetical protein
MAEGRFVLVFHEDMMANHAPIWDDDKALATWIRLLALADKIWPSPAELPRGASKSAVDRLIGAGLIEADGPHRFRIPSLDKKRDAARNAASNAARIRHGNAESNAESLPTRLRPDVDTDQTRNSAPASISLPVKGMDGSVVDVSVSDLQEDAAPKDADRLMKLAVELTGVPYISPYTGLGLKAVTEQLPHGYSRVESVWRRVATQTAAAGTSKPTLRQLVISADNILNPIVRQDEKETREQDAAEAFNRRVERTQRELAANRRPD